MIAAARTAALDAGAVLVGVDVEDVSNFLSAELQRRTTHGDHASAGEWLALIRRVEWMFSQAGRA